MDKISKLLETLFSIDPLTKKELLDKLSLMSETIQAELFMTLQEIQKAEAVTLERCLRNNPSFQYELKQIQAKYSRDMMNQIEMTSASEDETYTKQIFN